MVSIILLCRDRWEETRRCLKALRRNTAPGAYELLLYDNASTDATPERLKASAPRWPELQVRRNPRNLPFARAVNEGMRASRGEHFLWLNNDVVVGPGWLEGLLGALESDSGLAAVGPRTDRMAPPAQLGPPAPGSEVRPTPFLGGFCFLIRAEDAKRAGSLDERFIWGWEDIDYCLRLRQSGRGLGVADKIFVRHGGGRTMLRLPAPERMRTDAANRRLLLEKWVAGEPFFSDLTGLMAALPDMTYLQRKLPAENPPLLSVAVYNRRGGAPDPECLKATRAALRGLRCEVLAHAPLSEVRRHDRSWPQLKLSPWPGPGSLPWSLNLLLRGARGSRLVALCDDARPKPGLFQELAAAALEADNIGAVGPLTNGTTLRWQKGPRGPSGTFDRVHYLRDFCFMIPKSAYERVGGFDERFQRGAWFVDYCLRLSQSGLQVLVARGASARRVPGDWGTEHKAGILDGEGADAALLFEKWSGHPLFLMKE